MPGPAVSRLVHLPLLPPVVVTVLSMTISHPLASFLAQRVPKGFPEDPFGRNERPYQRIHTLVG
jgi:hypothetical protein